MANNEMDLVRRKLCKDLEVMECLKEEIEKAGHGEMRERLEEDFHQGMNPFPIHLFVLPDTDCRVCCLCGDAGSTERKSGGDATTETDCDKRIGRD